MRMIYCTTGDHMIRTDDGSYCDHYIEKHVDKGVESVTVIFRSPDGKISIPWDHSSPCPAGYQREEVRGPKALRKLERELDAADIKRHNNFRDNRDRLFAPMRQQRRDDLQQIVRDGVTVHEGRTIRVTQQGRDIARAALERSERGYSDRYDPGNHRRD